MCCGNNKAAPACNNRAQTTDVRVVGNCLCRAVEVSLCLRDVPCLGSFVYLLLYEQDLCTQSLFQVVLVGLAFDRAAVGAGVDWCIMLGCWIQQLAVVVPMPRG